MTESNTLFRQNIFHIIGNKMQLDQCIYPNRNNLSLNYNVLELKQKYIDKLNKQLYSLNFEMNALNEIYNELTNRIIICKLKHTYTFTIFDKTYYNTLCQLETIDKKITILEDCIRQLRQQIINAELM